MVAFGQPPARLPIYEPSHVVTDTRYWTVLSSPDSIEAVSNFYTAELGRQGWTTTSKVTAAAAATIVARSGPHSAMVSIHKLHSGTSVTIATY